MSTATRRALYGRLAGDTTLNNLLGPAAPGYTKAIYHQQAPAEAEYPLIVFQKTSGTPTEAFGAPNAFENEVWMVKGIDQSTSADTAEAIQARIKALLNDATLSISGSNLQYLRRMSDVEYPEIDDGVAYQHAGSNFRLVTS